LLVLTHDRLEAAPNESRYASRIERAAIGTTYLVALRTIIAFFENDDGKYKTGMTASDYCTDPLWDPRTDGARTLRDLRATKDRINERVTHIDVERVRNRAQIAQRATVWEKVNRLVARFHARVDTDWQSRFYPSLEVARVSIRAAGPSGPPDVLAGTNAT
jgi:hypothetical protein